MAFVLDLANAEPANHWPTAVLREFRSRYRALFWMRNSQGESSGAAASFPLKMKNHDAEFFEGLRDWTRSQLEGFLDDERGKVIVGLTSAVVILDLRRDADGRPFIRAVKAEDGDAYALIAAFLLASEFGERLYQCVDEKCGRYFIKRGRRRACSAACAKRVYMREFRQR